MDAQYGRIIFTTKEPLENYYFLNCQILVQEKITTTRVLTMKIRKYVFRSMYRNTQSGALQDSDKNKFLLRGRYKSSGGDGIPIGALNVPPGSVVVTAAGRILVEGSMEV
jgi:cell surface protein SprA